MGKERVLHENWPQKPLNSFSGRHDPEFSEHTCSGTFKILRRELPRVRGRFTSHVPIEELEVFDGDLVICQRILTQTGPIDSLRGSGVVELLSKIKPRKTSSVSA